MRSTLSLRACIVPFVVLAVAPPHDRRQAEVDRLHAELGRRNRDLDDFAHIVGHDLRAPLRAIMHLSAWIEEDLGDKLSDEGRKNLDLLRDRVRRLDGMVTALLEYSSVGRAGTDVVDVDTGALVREVVAALDPPAGFRVEVAPRMPVLRAGRVHLWQVFQNLISNAVQHHDRPQGTIRVASEDLGERVAFRVDDDGPGIPPEHRERAFRIFQTLRPKDEGGTNGVGLALVKRIVERQGGEVRIEDAPGRGARVRFTWPKEPPGGAPS